MTSNIKITDFLKVRQIKKQGNNERKTQLITRANLIIENNHGVLYKSSIGILKHGLKNATEKDDFEDLEEFVPKFEKKNILMKKKLEQLIQERTEDWNYRVNLYIKSHSLEQLRRKLAKLEKETIELMKKWSERRPDERTQRKATISNRADSVAKAILLVKDAIDIIEKRK